MRARHSSWHTDSNNPKPLPQRRTRYPLFHLTVKIKIVRIAPLHRSAFHPTKPRKATRMQKLNAFRKQRKSLICFEIRAKRENCEICFLACYCQGSSRLLISSHIKRGVSEVGALRKGAE